MPALVLHRLADIGRGVQQAPLATIALSPQGEHWRVEYTLPRPVRELRFARADHAGNRIRDWTPLGPGVVFVMEDGVEVVQRSDGRSFSSVGFDVLPRYRPLAKDYGPFSPFGDGGLLLHSGTLPTFVPALATRPP